jgi:PDZ domain-containing secreted protein
LLSDRLNGSAAGGTRLLLSIAIASSAIVASIAIVMYLDQTAKLADQSRIIDYQEQEILEQEAAMAGQQAEIEARSVQLLAVQSQIQALSAELELKEQNLQDELSNSGNLELEIASLENQAVLLQTQIEALQSKIQIDEQRIAELSRQNSMTERTIVTHFGVGVDQNNEGTVFPIKVEIIRSGSGILSVDINNVQYEPGFQSAVRAAAIAASQYSGQSISDKDIIVRFAYEESLFGGEPVKVDGSSAGAVIAAMIAAGLSNAELNDSVLLTGSISEDGTVGRVGSLEQKVVAADTFGAQVMLVPESQEFDSDLMSVVGVSDINEIMARLTG